MRLTPLALVSTSSVVLFNVSVSKELVLDAGLSQNMTLLKLRI
jgi:hypothetical protein